MTPTGLLQVGDVIVNTATGIRWSVLKRLGNDINYAVRIRPIGAPLPPPDRSRGYTIMTEASYWLKNGWLHDPAR